MNDSFRRHLPIRPSAAYLLCVALLCASAFSAEPEHSLKLSRPIRSWEFVSAVGTRAGIFGNEQGNMEAWVYPLKIFRDFHLRFHMDGAVLPAEVLARTLIVKPESTTIVYTGDVFSVRETLFVPVHEAGAVISFEIETSEPLEIEAVFNRDFELEWPGTVGGVTEEWDPILRAFHFGEESAKFDALVGSHSANKISEEYATNYFSSHPDSILLGPSKKGKETKLIVVAASFTGRKDLVTLYNHLAKDYSALLSDSAKYYEDYLDRTVALKLPDPKLQTAYDWAKVSMVQGLVENPFLGEGLIAGFSTSGDDQRPGFAWFFGRDAEWTALALDAAGDFATARKSLDFLSKYQRADGKIPHEISQSASFMDWFNSTKYAYASADATPLFIIAVDDYVTHSADLEFANQKWDNLWRAHQFLRSTDNPQGLAQNFGIGHGWIEGGPLYPTKMELYQAALGLEAERALSHIAHLVGKDDVSHDLALTFEKEEPILDETFWSSDKKVYAYALDQNDKRVDVASVLAAVPMWFGLLNETHADAMIRELASSDYETDWGMRIISARDPRYDPSGYHFGVVWPLFTGWASVGEYRYHRPLPAYSNLRANALLSLDGSLGHVTEVLSGKYYQTLSTGSPHQIWSAAMIVNPLLTGMLGLHADASSCHLDFEPHVPADWTSFAVDHLTLGPTTLNISYQRELDRIRLEVKSSGPCAIEFSPAVSLRAKVTGVRLDGRKTPFHLEPNSLDQHVTVNMPLSAGNNRLEIEIKDDFQIGETATLPELGSTSHGLRVLSQSWSQTRDALTLTLAGRAGEGYELSAWNPGQIASIEGAELEKGTASDAKVRIKMPDSTDASDPQATVVFRLHENNSKPKLISTDSNPEESPKIP